MGYAVQFGYYLIKSNAEKALEKFRFKDKYHVAEEEISSPHYEIRSATFNDLRSASFELVNLAVYSDVNDILNARIIEVDSDYKASKEYQYGVIDMYKIARRIVMRPEDGGYTDDELKFMYGVSIPSAIFKNITAYNIITRAEEKEIEEEREIVVGDIVVRRTDANERFWVNATTDTGTYFSGIALSSSSCVPIGASVMGLLVDDFKKTGEHRDLNCITKAVE